jgi:hypothetical protein
MQCRASKEEAKTSRMEFMALETDYGINQN